MGRYALGLTKGLLAAGAPVAAVTTLPGANQPALPSEVRPLAIPATAGAVRSVVGESFTWVATAPLDAPSYPARVIPGFVAEAGGPVAAVAYDLIPFAHPDRSFGTERDRLWYLGRLVGVRGADLRARVDPHAAPGRALAVDAGRAPRAPRVDHRRALARLRLDRARRRLVVTT